MDMPGAEKAADKLLKFVQSVAMSDSKLYGKSKQRLQSIADVCSQVVTAVSSILQTEILQSEQQEFESKPNVDIYEQVATLSAEIDKLKEFIQFSESAPNSSDNESTSQVEEVVDDEPVEKSNNTESGKLSSDEMKEIVSKYGAALRDAATTDSGSEVCNRLADVLWRWFQNRIFTQYSNAPPFHYGVHRLKRIIYSFVILYGWYIENRTEDMFFRYFEDWLTSLRISSDSNKWIAPYEVYQIERNMNAKYANLTSVVLWDILMDNTSLSCLKSTSSQGYYLHDAGVWDMTFDADSSVLDSYVNYKQDKSILESLNLL